MNVSHGPLQCLDFSRNLNRNPIVLPKSRGIARCEPKCCWLSSMLASNRRLEEEPQDLICCTAQQQRKSHPLVVLEIERLSWHDSTRNYRTIKRVPIVNHLSANSIDFQ